MSWIVLFRPLMNLPMVLCSNDGDKKVVRGGVLFVRTKDLPYTIFPDRYAAEDAVDRTILHKRLRNVVRTEADYGVVTLNEWQESNSPSGRRAKRSKQSTEEVHHAVSTKLGPAGGPDAVAGTGVQDGFSDIPNFGD